ncbi:MAG: polymerase, sigma 32 subunit, RpoH [Clostridia bacterium]|jgi:RNA polymerase sigma factor (sigma-70 family)|nr:polymerase, sigma 32 subunit, RpoH [Clostridia bacterium]
MSNEGLVQLYQQGDAEALDKLLHQNRKFIHKISLKFFIGKDSAIDQEDLIQEGYIGLMKAAERYNPENEVQFISYAAYWIYQAMHRFIYPRRYMRENKHVCFSSLNDKVLGIEDEIEQIDMIADDDIYPGITDNVANKEDCFQVMNIIYTKMGDRAVEVIRLRYGLKDGKIHTLEDVGAMMGVAKETIRQLEQRAFRTVRTSKWCRLCRVEAIETEKSRVYDFGKFNLSFFDKLDHELKSMSLDCEGDPECVTSI